MPFISVGTKKGPRREKKKKDSTGLLEPRREAPSSTRNPTRRRLGKEGTLTRTLKPTIRGN